MGSIKNFKYMLGNSLMESFHNMVPVYKQFSTDLREKSVKLIDDMQKNIPAENRVPYLEVQLVPGFPNSVIYSLIGYGLLLRSYKKISGKIENVREL